MKRYVATHWFWDADDNEHELEAIWLEELNYPDAPDQWILCELELVEPEDGDLDVSKSSYAWASVELSGPPSYDKMSEEDYV
jgi:hypothetical protein